MEQGNNNDMRVTTPYLGLDFSFGFYHIPCRERLRLIRETGFDSVMVTWREESPEAAAPEEIFDAALSAGLRVNTMHAPTGHTPDLWRDTPGGADYEKRLRYIVRFCGEHDVPNLVLHTTKKFETPPPNAIGAERVRRLAEEAEKYEVNLAWENTRFLNYNAYLYAHVSSPRMRFCFDCGHANAFTPGEDPLARFGDRLVTVHLHDNHGPQVGDEHLLPGQGSIDFPALMRCLKPYGLQYYHLESHTLTRGTETEADMAAYLADAYARLSGLVH